MHATLVQRRDGTAHGRGRKCAARPYPEGGVGRLSVGVVRWRLQPSKLHLNGRDKRGRRVEGQGVGGIPKLRLTKEFIEDVECGDGPEAGPGGGRRKVGEVSPC